MALYKFKNENHICFVLKNFTSRFARHIFPPQKICVPKYLLLKVFVLSSPKHICSPVFFPRRIKFYSQKKSSPKILLPKFPPQIFAPKRICSSKTYCSKFLSMRICFQKNFLPIGPQTFALQVFIKKNLLPKFFIPKFCFQTLNINSKNFAPQILLPKIFSDSQIFCLYL